MLGDTQSGRKIGSSRRFNCKLIPSTAALETPATDSQQMLYSLMFRPARIFNDKTVCPVTSPYTHMLKAGHTTFSFTEQGLR